MSQNIFDQYSVSEQYTPEPPAQNQKSGLASFVTGTITLAIVAVVAPVYIHVLVKIATWSWNLI